MSAVERAIEFAKEEGWNEESTVLNAADEMGAFYEYRFALLDPLFWQALGKARGWEKIMGFPIVVQWHDEKNTIPNWQYQWHRFIDHLAAGNDAESFFQELLGEK